MRHQLGDGKQQTANPIHKESTQSNKRGRPNFLNNELVSKVNQIIYGSNAAGIGISIDDVIANVNTVNPNLL